MLPSEFLRIGKNGVYVTYNKVNIGNACIEVNSSVLGGQTATFNKGTNTTNSGNTLATLGDIFMQNFTSEIEYTNQWLNNRFPLKTANLISRFYKEEPGGVIKIVERMGLTGWLITTITPDGLTTVAKAV